MSEIQHNSGEVTTPLDATVPHRLVTEDEKIHEFSHILCNNSNEESFNFDVFALQQQPISREIMIENSTL